MLKALKFVQGAVAKRDFIPALTHFRITGGQILGFNGIIALSAPIAVDLDVAPNAAQFIRAIGACEKEIALHVQDNGKLVVRSGKFKSLVDCDDVKNFPSLQPSGTFIDLDSNFISALKFAEPYMATDESKPWACSVLFSGESAFATNSITLIEYWVGSSFPQPVLVPAAAIYELLRIKETPVRMQMTDKHVVFWYGDGRWLWSQLLEAKWPPASSLLDKAHSDARMFSLTDQLFEAFETLAPFVVKDKGSAVHMQGDRIATDVASDKTGTTVDVLCPKIGIYKIHQLIALRNVITGADFSKYPQPIPFAGERCRGIIMPIRL